MRFSNSVLESSYPWKNCSTLMAGSFGGVTGAGGGGSGVGNAGSGGGPRPPLFPVSSGYFPAAAFGYGGSAGFLTAGSFLRPDYPVFPGMNLLGGASSSSLNPSPLDLNPNDHYGPASYGAYHPANQAPSMVRHSVGVKQEDLTGLEDHSSPRSDHSSPFSD